jgi:putative peptidoglycan lipid II flippase
MEGPDTGPTLHSIAVTSRSVAWWTLLGRASGFLRVAAIAAVLGPTFFGNLFQTALLVPYTLSELLAGSLIPALLAPRLVRLLDEGDREGADRLAAGFLRGVVALLLPVAVAAAVAAPLIAWLVTLAVTDPEVRARQIALATPLLLTLLPQVVFDGIAAVGMAAQIARRRFMFATAAPIIENAGLVVTLIVCAVIFGIGREMDTVSLGEVLLLGLGATAAAALHAAAQVWGAHRAGFHLLRSGLTRGVFVGSAIRTAISSSGTAGLNSVTSLALVAAAGHVPGGAVALQIGQYLLNLPIALGVRSVATVQLPHLAASRSVGSVAAFERTYRDGLRLALFVALPVAAVFLALPQLLAGAFSLGGMSGTGATSLVAAALLGLAPGIVGEAVFVLSMSASYARLDALRPFQAMAARAVAYLVGIPLSLVVPDLNAALFCLGLTYSVGAWAGAGLLVLRLPSIRGALQGMQRWLAAELLVSAAAVIPALGIELWVPPRTSMPNALIDAALVLMTGGLYLAIQFARSSTELKIVFAWRVTAFDTAERRAE